MDDQQSKYTMKRQHKDLVDLKVNGEVFAHIMCLDQDSYLVVVYDVYAATFKTPEEAISFAKRAEPVFADLMQRGKFWAKDEQEYAKAESIAPSLTVNLKAMMKLCVNVLNDIEKGTYTSISDDFEHFYDLKKSITEDFQSFESYLLENL